MSLSADEGQWSCHNLFKVLQQLDKFLADIFTLGKGNLHLKREFRSLCYVVFLPHRLCFLHITHSQDIWIFKSSRELQMWMTHHSDSYSSVFRLTLAGARPECSRPAQDKCRIPPRILVKPQLNSTFQVSDSGDHMVWPPSCSFSHFWIYHIMDPPAKYRYYTLHLPIVFFFCNGLMMLFVH